MCHDLLFSGAFLHVMACGGAQDNLVAAEEAVHVVRTHDGDCWHSGRREKVFSVGNIQGIRDQFQGGSRSVGIWNGEALGLGANSTVKTSFIL